MDTSLLKTTAARLVALRAEVLGRYPFFGRLLMRLPFGFADCDTAYTDMQRIVFDPAFAGRLSDTELRFVLLHELMHCVLKHCLRGRGKMQLVYNIACDIVVNSVLLDALGEEEMTVDGSPAMHLTPDGKEGRDLTAEEVYELLLGSDELTPSGYFSFDTHDSWEDVDAAPLLTDLWDKMISDAGKAAGKEGSGIPNGLQRLVKQTIRKQQVCWQQVLQDYIRLSRSDYSYSPPDRRFADSDLILPSFLPNAAGSKVENIWYAIDTSGSVDDDAVSDAYGELKDAVDQMDQMEGFVSFFDTRITEPIPFESVEDLENITPIGGGGTSFQVIFDAMPRFFEEQLPQVLVIITDGYSKFPEEDAALDVPVVWIIVNSQQQPPWGEVIHIDTR